MGEGNIPMRSGKRVEREMFGEVVFKSEAERKEYHDIETSLEHGKWDKRGLLFADAVAWIKERQPLEKTVFLVRLKSEIQTLLLKEASFSKGDFRLGVYTAVHSYLDFRKDTDVLVEFVHKPYSDKQRTVHIRIDGTTNDIEGNNSSADVLIHFPNDGYDPVLDKRPFDDIVKRSALAVQSVIDAHFTDKAGPVLLQRRIEIDYEEIYL